MSQPDVRDDGQVALLTGTVTDQKAYDAYQMRQLQNSLLGIIGAAVGVTALAVVARRWLPESRLFRSAVLRPPEPAAEAAGAPGLQIPELPENSPFKDFFDDFFKLLNFLLCFLYNFFQYFQRFLLLFGLFFCLLLKD